MDTYPTSGDETDFLTGNGLAGDCRGLSDMLVVTTTVRMVNGVHSNTTSAGPAVSDITVRKTLKTSIKITYL